MQKQRYRHVGPLVFEQQVMKQCSQRGFGQWVRKPVLRDAIELVGCLPVVKPCSQSVMIRHLKVVMVGHLWDWRMTFWRSVIVTRSSEMVAREQGLVES